MTSSNAPEALLSTLTTIGGQILATKFAFISFYALYLYDYCLTLSDEVEYIWKRKFTFVTFLFCMNRYYAMAVFTVVLSGFFSPLYTPQIARCKHYSSFLPLAVGLPMVILPGIVMGLRVSALYSQGKIVTGCVFLFLSAETGVALWIYTRPGNGPLQFPDVVHGDAFQICIQEVALGHIQAAAFQFMETAYDTIIFIMIIHKTIQTLRSGRKSILAVVGAHGVLYFFVVFTCNFIWAMFIIFQPDGLKYSAALPTTMYAFKLSTSMRYSDVSAYRMGCVVVNRITLDLRASSSTKGWFESVHCTPAGDSSIPLRPQDNRNAPIDETSLGCDDIEMSRMGLYKST
ncbi:hypothetical protein ACEPAI_4255 [Sanghuangporus weigelae]